MIFDPKSAAYLEPNPLLRKSRGHYFIFPISEICTQRHGMAELLILYLNGQSIKYSLFTLFFREVVFQSLFIYAGREGEVESHSSHVIF